MKNKIQLFILGLLLLPCLFLNQAHWYKFTWEELDKLNDQKSILNKSSDKELRNYFVQLSNRFEILKPNDKLWSTVLELKDYAQSKFFNRKEAAYKEWEGLKANFISKYSDKITFNEDFPDNKCFWRYNTIDNISFANNFPTALTIAVWYRESTCSYYLPSNGDWPFQIVSKDYWTWEINEEIFTQIIQDFIDFSKKKIARYNEKNEGEYTGIQLTYTWFSYEDLWKFAWLYNGLSGSTVYGEIGPAAPKYFLEWYEDFENSKRFWLLPAFIKVLERESETRNA